MRCASDNFTQKNALPNALPIISISYKNCAVRQIIFVERIRCTSDYFPRTSALPVGIFSSIQCAAVIFLASMRYP